MVTERVEPLADWLASANSADAKTLACGLCWGLYSVAKALSFINNDCKMVHGNVCRDSVFVAKVWECGCCWFPSTHACVTPVVWSEW